MNKFIGMGRLTKDPDVRYVDGKDGKMCVAKYNLAIDRYGSHASSEQSADFIRCTAFGKNGEFTEKYLKCGTKIVIEAHVQTGSFDDNMFFASTFWTKLQNIFGHCCMSKLDKVAKRWPVMIRPAI